MPFLAPTDLRVFNGPDASDPDRDLERVRLRDRLAWLHQQIYPEIRARRWDMHPHWVPQYLISTARLVPPVAEIRFLLLRYAKAETTVKLMRRDFGEDFNHPYRTGLLGVRVDHRGVGIEFLIGDRAWPDAQNFKTKLVHGAPQKRHLRQLFAELGGDFTLTLQSADGVELLRARCSRLVHLGTLDDLLARYCPGQHQFQVTIRYPPDDPRLEAEVLPTEALLRLGQLYLLYQFAVWSPRNDYMTRPAAPKDQTDSGND